MCSNAPTSMFTILLWHVVIYLCYLECFEGLFTVQSLVWLVSINKLYGRVCNKVTFLSVQKERT